MSVAARLRRRGWGSRGDCRLPGGLEEIRAALLGVGGSSSKVGPSTSSASGEKGDSRRGVQLFSLSVPSSFSQLVCGSLWRRLLLPSAAGPHVNEIKSKKKPN